MKHISINRIALLLAFVFIQSLALAQSKDIKLPANWFNLDLQKDGYFGISTERAYQELLKNKKPKARIIVAILDSGVDTLHEDLKDVLWVNTKELKRTGKDEDGNGYIGDVHGWSFLGSKGKNVQYDNMEMVRLLRIYAPKYQSVTNQTPLDSGEKVEYKLYQRLIGDFGKEYQDASETMSIIYALKSVLDTVAKEHNKAIPTLEDVNNYKASNDMEEQIKKIINRGSKEDGSFEKFYDNIQKGFKQYDAKLKYHLNAEYDPRASLVGDNYADSYERIYGNSDVTGPDAEHGTHVAGIIGANRSNNLGVLGVANNVSLMAVRVVPDGDERDKDIANGIRYAVDNGARVINMSFGKGYKWDKKVVDDAVKYAQSKSVLLVHAAGNDNKNLDLEDNYPNRYFESPEWLAYEAKKPADGDTFKPMMQRPDPRTGEIPERRPSSKKVDTAKFALPHASNWLEVGASAYKDGDELKASFSNYGKYSVDVFAPGFMINSTVPGNKYEENDGTSMAAPVVSGLAALILSYYPELSAEQVKDIIMKSVTKVARKVKNKNENDINIRVPFSDFSISGGIVNAYEALKLAESYKK